MKSRKKLIIGGAIILIAVVVLVYATAMGNGAYYYEVGEFLDQGALVADKITSVNGEIGADLTVDNFVFSFTLLDATGRSASMPVVYKGQVPSSFEVGRLAVVQGKLNPEGVFQATKIITKCSSKD
jgi:cytochrome c-type biogenesis protein CcmE